MQGRMASGEGRHVKGGQVIGEQAFGIAGDTRMPADEVERDGRQASADAAGLPRTAPLAALAEVQDDRARVLQIVVSTARMDRQGDRIETGGLDFSNYLKNPVVLWAHDLQRPPVGKVLEVSRTADEVRAVVQFADTPFAREVYSLYAGGFLNAWSVGFLPQRWRRLREEEGGGYHIQQAEVVEISAVPVPANPEALTKALEQAAGARVGQATMAAPGAIGMQQAARAVAKLLGRLAGEAVWNVRRRMGD